MSLELQLSYLKVLIQKNSYMIQLTYYRFYEFCNNIVYIEILFVPSTALVVMFSFSILYMYSYPYSCAYPEMGDRESGPYAPNRKNKKPYFYTFP